MAQIIRFVQNLIFAHEEQDKKKPSLQSLTSSVAGVLEFKKEKARLDFRRKKWNTEMFDEWQMKCNKLLKAHPKEASFLIGEISQQVL